MTAEVEVDVVDAEIELVVEEAEVPGVAGRFEPKKLENIVSEINYFCC